VVIRQLQLLTAINGRLTTDNGRLTTDWNRPMDLSTVHHGVRKLKKKKRIGRGLGSGHGKTASHGGKGQWGRAGAGMPRALSEGGQMSIIRRIPKRGFSHNTWRKIYAVVNVGDLNEHFEDGATVDHATLKAAGLANGAVDGVRILGDGELTKKLTVKAHGFSASAKKKIEDAKGTAELVPGPKPPVKNKMKPRPPKNAQ
jgi:large subunit ribosomal protein L15